MKYVVLTISQELNGRDMGEIWCSYNKSGIEKKSYAGVKYVALTISQYCS